MDNQIPTLENTRVTKTYNKIATAFSNTRTKPWDWIQKFLKSLPNKGLILDIGCGNGRNMVNVLEGQNLTFKGVDSCQSFVDIAVKNGKDVILSDMCQLPFEDNSFDAILSIASFHHLSTPERREKGVQEMRRVLKPGGKILMSVWAIIQPEHSKNYGKFKYGDNMVPWKNKNGEIEDERYYYIFQIEELTDLILDEDFHITNWTWNYGNEVITLGKPDY
jgi:tRNA (uracil-5-)-methyltransferase TRM9